MISITNNNNKFLFVKGILGIRSWVLGFNEKTNKNFVLYMFCGKNGGNDVFQLDNIFF